MKKTILFFLIIFLVSIPLYIIMLPISPSRISKNTTKDYLDQKTLVNSHKIKNVPILNQLPEMPTGCELTSAAMLLNWYGVDVDKNDLGYEIEKAPIPSYVNGTLQGMNPNEYFIGDPFSDSGFGVYHKPIKDLIDTYTSGKGKDITDCSFETLIEIVSKGTPIITWVTIDMKEATLNSSWYSKNGIIEWIVPEHAVVLIGFNENEVIINDPYTGTEYNINKSTFIDRWNSLGNQAVTIDLNS
ncbi:Hypothetical protein CM240_3095 [Clostridium bornimense]|uniref:Peptidase C39-like domain-containing protein n=1 Tax=Clostridium bornimense TaxID=1216932 RepID=W6S718_9CLOT|nr:C39 family peptidase [Clostridium bornimense]CDM70212.1 Hypothetical protein CM240_3095 [Clostridium bornimense]